MSNKYANTGLNRDAEELFVGNLIEDHYDDLEMIDDNMKYDNSLSPVSQRKLDSIFDEEDE